MTETGKKRERERETRRERKRDRLVIEEGIMG